MFISIPDESDCVNISRSWANLTKPSDGKYLLRGIFVFFCFSFYAGCKGDVALVTGIAFRNLQHSETSCEMKIVTCVPRKPPPAPSKCGEYDGVSNSARTHKRLTDRKRNRFGKEARKSRATSQTPINSASLSKRHAVRYIERRNLLPRNNSEMNGNHVHGHNGDVRFHNMAEH